MIDGDFRNIKSDVLFGNILYSGYRFRSQKPEQRHAARLAFLDFRPDGRLTLILYQKGSVIFPA